MVINKEMETTGKKSAFKKGIIIFVVLTLATSYMAGLLKKETQVIQKLENVSPEGTELEKISENPLLFRTENPTAPTSSIYIIINTSKGWGGPLQTATIIDKMGILQQVLILDHKETLSFIHKIQKNDFFKQFIGKKVTDPFIPGVDIDSVTQATVSSKGFTEAVRKGSHTVGKKIFHLQIKEEQSGWKFGLNEILLVLIYFSIFISFFLKIPMLRYITMTVSFFFLGFYLNSSLSIAHFSSLLLGYFPSLKENPFWWILVTGALLSAFLLRKNLYCYGICPFGALQEFNNKISGINIRLNRKITKYTKYLSYILAWFALIVTLLTSKPAIGAYEPFPTIFGLQGMDIQWFILPVVILGSFVLSKFFCRFFCPVGVILKIIIKARRQLDKFIRRT